jgi:hypothetical protein
LKKAGGGSCFLQDGREYDHRALREYDRHMTAKRYVQPGKWKRLVHQARKL